MSDLAALPPGVLLILGALLAPLLRGRIRSVWLLVLPLASWWHQSSLPLGAIEWSFMDLTLAPLRVDRLSLLWGTVFHLAAWLAVLYSLHVDDALESAACLAYAGAAIAAVFAGDLVTLFVFWELTAITSTLVIWARRSERAYRAGMRYLILQVASGVLLLVGTIAHVGATGSLAFGQIGLDSAGGVLILLAFGLKAAFPLLHSWLADAYPEATPTGTVFLSAFTTKLAIYALARGFAGTELLVPLGLVMAVFPLVYAAIEDDLRRVLAYGINVQLGFMVVGVGVGTELALNGTAAHAVSHILYKALLYMALGAVLHRTGTARASELGGLHRSMPWTTLAALIGTMAMSAPLFCGFVSKGLLLSAIAEQHQTATYVLLLLASAAVFCVSGLRVVRDVFFGPDRGYRNPEAPLNMRVAMGLLGAFCLGLGAWPTAFYHWLPYPVEYAVYSADHVATGLQLLVFSALAYFWLRGTKRYPAAATGPLIDSDWTYRRLVPALVRATVSGLEAPRQRYGQWMQDWLEATGSALRRALGPYGRLASSGYDTGQTVTWVTALLGALLILYYL